MKKPVFIGAFIASLLLAALNNLFNSRSVEWFGSPDVLEKPSGWPSMGIAQGLQAGFKVAWKGFLAHQWLILGGLAVLAVIIFLLRRNRNVPLGPMLRTVLRVGLGLMFLAAAWPKFMDPKSFASLVAQYQFLPAFVVNPFTLWLSAFEIVVGIGILITLVGKGVRRHGRHPDGDVHRSAGPGPGPGFGHRLRMLRHRRGAGRGRSLVLPDPGRGFTVPYRLACKYRWPTVPALAEKPLILLP